MRRKTKREGLLDRKQDRLPTWNRPRRGAGQSTSLESQRSYQHSINEFVGWYCSSRAYLQQDCCHSISNSPGRSSLGTRDHKCQARCGAQIGIRSADSGLLSPDLAAGIRRVKGSKKLGFRLGNWLTAAEARTLWQLPDPATLKAGGTGRFCILWVAGSAAAS